MIQCPYAPDLWLLVPERQRERAWGGRFVSIETAVEKCSENVTTLKANILKNNKASDQILHVCLHVICRNFSNGLRIGLNDDILTISIKSCLLRLIPPLFII